MTLILRIDYAHQIAYPIYNRQIQQPRHKMTFYPKIGRAKILNGRHVGYGHKYPILLSEQLSKMVNELILKAKNMGDGRLISDTYGVVKENVCARTGDRAGNKNF